MFSGAIPGQAASWGLALYGRTVSGISNDWTSLTGEILIGGWRCTRGTHIAGSRCTNGGKFVYAEMQSDLAQISMFHWNDHQATSLDFYPDMYPDGLDIRVMMQAYSGLVGTADGWDTGLLSLALPSNITYTSNSGVFLSNPQSTSVPEPAGWLLTGLALVALFTTRRARPGRMQGVPQRAV